jgi:hypothetical protein
VHPAVTPRRTPPGPAIAAAVLGVLSAAVPALFALLALAFSNGQFDDGGWALVLVPLVLLAGLVVGAVLLLAGRSWLVLALCAGVLTALVVTGYATGAWSGDSLGVLALAVPLLTTVLAVLPGVRGWIAARRIARAGR